MYFSRHRDLFSVNKHIIFSKAQVLTFENISPPTTKAFCNILEYGVIPMEIC